VNHSHAVGLWPSLEALRWRPGRVVEVLIDPRLPPHERAQLTAACAAAGVPLREDRAAVRSLRAHRGADVACRLSPEPDALAADLDHLVLVQPAQAGNVGAALRSALGFGLLDIALIGSRVDPWSPHLLRASQGARFALRVRSWATWDDYRHTHPGHARVALLPPQRGDTVALAALQAPTPAAWIFGPEGGSLPPACSDGALRASIPQDPRLESHNLAVAVGIALYARANPPSGGRG
jgi:RNA methyltransferase, TrmH family